MRKSCKRLAQALHAPSPTRPAPAAAPRSPAGNAAGSAGRIAGDDAVGRDILGDDGAAGDDGARADAAAGQDDGAMADPDIMADGHRRRASPGEEIGVILRIVEIGRGAIGEMRLARPLHRVIAGVDPGMGGDRAELADGRVDDVGIVHDIGVVAHRRLDEGGAGADLGIAPQRRLPQLRGRIDHGLEPELLGHGSRGVLASGQALSWHGFDQAEAAVARLLPKQREPVDRDRTGRHGLRRRPLPARPRGRARPDRRAALPVSVMWKRKASPT